MDIPLLFLGSAPRLNPESFKAEMRMSRLVQCILITKGSDSLAQRSPIALMQTWEAMGQSQVCQQYSRCPRVHRLPFLQVSREPTLSTNGTRTMTPRRGFG